MGNARRHLLGLPGDRLDVLMPPQSVAPSMAQVVDGSMLPRSAGCVINDYADRWLDPQVERTRDRPLATGAVSGREALAVFAVLMLVAFGLVLTMNRLTVLLSFVGLDCFKRPTNGS